MIPLFLLILTSYSSKGQNYSGEVCGNVTTINARMFELPSPNTPQRINLNQTVDFKLGEESYSFLLKDDENLLIYHYMLKMINEAQKKNTFVGVRYKTQPSGKKKIVSMAFCKENEDCDCFIE